MPLWTNNSPTARLKAGPPDLAKDKAESGDRNTNDYRNQVWHIGMASGGCRGVHLCQRAPRRARNCAPCEIAKAPGCTRGRRSRSSLGWAKPFAPSPQKSWQATASRPLVIADAAPTPAISYAVIHEKADGAINFTASHNPPEYNGIKFSTPDGAPRPARGYQADRKGNR